MPVAPLQCPHCAGPLQVETASAGQQLLCPHCQGALVVPPEDVLAQMLATMPEMEGPPSAPVPGDAVTLACPVCTGPFQVLPAMSGQQLGCPHCGSPITIPLLGPIDYSTATVPSQSAVTEPMPGAFYPSGFLGDASTADVAASIPPPDQPPIGSNIKSSDRYPPGMQPPVDERGRQETRDSVSPATGQADDRFPPGLAPPKIGRRTEVMPPERQRPLPASEDRYPPGMKPTSERSAPPEQPTRLFPHLPPPNSAPGQPRVEDLLPPGAGRQPTQPAAAAPAPDQMHSAGPAVIDLLPPGAAAAPVSPMLPPAAAVAAEIDALLPPGALASTASPAGAAPAHQATVLDALLPPGAARTDSAATAGAQVPIPAAPRKSAVAAANLPAGAIAVPTPDGGFVTVRETPKTIGQGEDAVEIRRLSPEERARRRLRNNLIMGSFCLIVIIVVVIVLML